MVLTKQTPAVTNKSVKQPKCLLAQTRQVFEKLEILLFDTNRNYAGKRFHIILLTRLLKTFWKKTYKTMHLLKTGVAIDKLQALIYIFVIQTLHEHVDGMRSA